MEKDTRERIAIKRYQIISPVLAEPARAQNDYFRKQAEREHDFPHYGPRKISLSTMKSWLRVFRRRGFNALKPKERSDGGRPRRLNDQLLKVIKVKSRPIPTSPLKNSLKSFGISICSENRPSTTIPFSA